MIYFVTICVKDRKQVLANEAVFNALKMLLQGFANGGDPNARSSHVVVAPSERDGRLGNFSAALKRWMRKDLNASWEWQPGCFDRLLRSEESLHEKWLYIQENPVRAGLARQWKDWPYRFEFSEEQ